MTKYELVVTGDTNDADYVTQISTVTIEDIVRIIPIAEAIKNCDKHYNWPFFDHGDDSVFDLYPDMVEEVEWFAEMYGPYGENGVHTIESIEYYPLPEKVKLL